uniref:RING-type E3 ubiquitin transferase n=1 Tax=Marmota marmota marmota TaxID=9994 RepID=A0A8C5Z9S3_MARMA
MSTEEARFLTYNMWPLTFLSPLELARAGFYYVGPGDRVACFACGGKLKHRRHFPNCPFLENSLETLRFSISNLSMQTHTARMRTFMYWPASVPVQPEQFASASFYYMDRNDDVKCFCCDGGLRCWESGDDPWVEHAKWFPRCEFLIRMKGQEFVDEIQARYPHLPEQLLSTSDTPGEENAEPIVHLGPGENDLSLIRKNTMALFQQLTCVLPILDNLLKANIPLQARELIDTILVKGNAAANIFKNCLNEIDYTLYENLYVEKNMKYIPTEDVSGLPLEEQLRRLQEEITCKVCMDKEVSIVFIPCGHLVICQEYAPSLRKCPICRGIIKGTLHFSHKRRIGYILVFLSN